MNTYDTETLVGVVNGLDPFTPFLLMMFFPEVITFDSSSIDIDVVAPDMRLAPFVSPMVAGKADTANGYSTRKFKPAYLKPKNIIDPEQVITRQAGEKIGGGVSNGNRRDAIIAFNLLNQRNKIMRRLEWMAAQALLSGTVTVEGEDYPTVVVDFQRTAGNLTHVLGLPALAENRRCRFRCRGRPGLGATAQQSHLHGDITSHSIRSRCHDLPLS